MTVKGAGRALLQCRAKVTGIRLKTHAQPASDIHRICTGGVSLCGGGKMLQLPFGHPDSVVFQQTVDDAHYEPRSTALQHLEDLRDVRLVLYHPAVELNPCGRVERKQ